MLPSGALPFPPQAQKASDALSAMYPEDLESMMNLQCWSYDIVHNSYRHTFSDAPKEGITYMSHFMRKRSTFVHPFRSKSISFAQGQLRLIIVSIGTPLDLIAPPGALIHAPRRAARRESEAQPRDPLGVWITLGAGVRPGWGRRARAWEASVG